ncbi:MAG TPA: hypothetical protein VLC48_02810 [Gemmatimonadota bacterium]|nr:hypothetical protein [Gemmatimonadota bacterium]
MRFYRLVLQASICLTVALAAVACSSDSIGPQSESLELGISIATTGETIDADGYVLVINRSDSLTVDAVDSVSVLAAASDTMELWLTEMTPNCIVDGDNPRSITLVRQTVACHPGPEGSARAFVFPASALHFAPAAHGGRLSESDVGGMT